jgi:hypothetical protein
MNKWIAVVVLDLMVLTAAVGLKAISTPAAQATTKAASKVVSAPVPWVVSAPVPW